MTGDGVREPDLQSLGGHLPKGWVWTTLGELSDLINGDRGENYPSRSAFVEQGIPFINAGHLRDGHVDLSDMNYISEETFSLLRSGKVIPGDVLYCLRGSLGKAAVVSGSVDRGAIASSLVIVRPHSSTLPAYVYAYLVSPLGAKMVETYDNGTAQPNLSGKNVESYLVPLAPLPEQHRIVAAIEDHFSRLDEAVALLTRVQRNLKRYRASVLKAAVEGRLVPTEAALARAEGRAYEPADVLLKRILDERWRRWKAEVGRGSYKEPVAPDTTGLPELPEGWCWASCAQVLSRLQTGPFGSSLHQSDYVEGGTPVVNPQHLQDYGIHPSSRVAVSDDTVERLSAFLLDEGDIVLGRRGEMGRCAVVGPREKGWLLGTGSLALKSASGLHKDYLAWVLRSPRVVSTLEGESVGTTMTNLNQEILMGLPVPLPPAIEQIRIVQEIERHLSIIKALEQSGARHVTRCTRLRQSILKWAFEGKLADQDPADEPASVLLERIRGERGLTRRGRRL